MADTRPSPARFIVPAVMALLVAVLAVLLLRPGSAGAQAGSPPAQAPAPSGAPASTSAVDAATPPTAAPVPADGVPPNGASLRAPLSTRPQPLQTWDTIGSLDGGKGPLLRIGFSPAGAGVLELALARHHTGTAKTSPNEVLQQTQVVEFSDGSSRKLVPFSLVEVVINDQRVSLAGLYTDSSGKAVASDWKQTGPGQFQAEVLDGLGAPIATVHRTFTLIDGVYGFEIRQWVQNLTAAPITVRFTQLGPVELPIGVIRYGGDPRRVRLGILPPGASSVQGREVIHMRDAVLGKPASVNGQWAWPDVAVFPTPDTAEEGQALAWAGMANRFFAVTVNPPRSSSTKLLDTWAATDRVVLTRAPDKDGRVESTAAMALRGVSPLYTVQPGQAAHADAWVYAGPVDRETLAAADKFAGGISLRDLEIYFFPGPCSFCTFQPIAYFLRWVLSLFATYVVFDWALAIILLVVCVRTALHPITKWSQMSLQRFGKQMQKLAPKQKALQEKFKDDPARLRQEMANLMREENVNYAGMLGCLPMFLQTPIWIALSSLMFFLFDLRHTPAFFGVVQKLTGGSWQFMADLAEPDHFIPLPFTFDVPLMGQIDAVNILPVVLGIVFFVQQKYLTPPSSTPLSPEMELQQKIMKVMIVFLFPLMMYNAPSGLALYFITNSTLGIIESKHIRAQFEKSEAAREELLKRDPHALRRKPEQKNFLQRFQDRLAQAQAQAEQLKKQRDAKRRD